MTHTNSYLYYNYFMKGTHHVTLFHDSSDIRDTKRDLLHLKRHSLHIKRNLLHTKRDVPNIKRDLLISEDLLQAFPSLIHWKKEHCDLMMRVMLSMRAWQSRSLQTFWSLNKKILTLRGEVDTKGRGNQNYFGGASRKTENNIFAEVKVLNSNLQYQELEKDVRAKRLDLEWYDRLLIMHKRDRQHLRAGMPK